MTTQSPHTALITAMAICLAAALAVATTAREHASGLPPAGLGVEAPFSSR